MLPKVYSLSSAYELVICQLCQLCSDLDLNEIGQFMARIHLQQMEVLKWVTRRWAEIPRAPSPEQRAPPKNTVNKNNFYRVKESSLFFAKGIDRELQKLSKEIKQEEEEYDKEVDKILMNKEEIIHIEPSNSQEMLFEALEVIENHGQVLERLGQLNQEVLRDISVKPFAKIKFEMDEAFKDRIKNSMQKISTTLSKYIHIEDEKVAESLVEKNSISVQVNMFNDVIEKMMRDEKAKTVKLQDALRDAQFEKIRADKLE